MELSVGELAQVLGQSQPRVSRHVKILIDAGLAERRKEGSWVFLSLGRPERIEPLFALLDEWAELDGEDPWAVADKARLRSEEHTSELQSLMRISYAVFCLKKKIID